MKTTDYKKFEHVLALLSTPPAVPEGYVGYSTDPAEREKWLEYFDVSAKYFDTVFEYIHANFAVPETATVGNPSHNEVELCREILEDRVTAYENMRKIPPVLLETVFPIAVASYIMSTSDGLKLPVLIGKTEQFREFYKRYGFMILESVTRRQK